MVASVVILESCIIQLLLLSIEGSSSFCKSDLRADMMEKTPWPAVLCFVFPKLGFIDSGLGPLPDNPFARFKLNSLLDDMIAQQGGQLVYDVKLLNFFDDLQPT